MYGYGRNGISKMNGFVDLLPGVVAETEETG